MTTAERIIAMSQLIGADLKTLTTKQGDLTSLNTTAKTSLVFAINELFTLISNSTAIDDLAGDGIVNKTWSANKIYDTIEAAKTAVKSELLGGASAAFDTLGELQAIVLADEGLAAAMATSISNRVRFDVAQSLSVAEKLQACTNIGVGNPDTDFVAAYNAAKA